MWQVLIAAAVAGTTGLVAKSFLGSPAQLEDSDPQETSPPPLEQPWRGGPGRGESSTLGGDEIFRFSSSGSSSGKKKTKTKKKKGKGKEKEIGGARRRLPVTDRPSECTGCSEAAGSGGRKFVVRLKRRRTSKSVLSKSSSTKENSLFSWGLGVGMMCMMSAGKSEISKLSAAMDETSKVVNELRTEVCKRKAAQVAASSSCTSSSSRGVRNTDDVKIARLPFGDDLECPSSVLTEEPEPEVLDMDQLEAELKSELLKLPWSSDEASTNDMMQMNLDMAKASTNNFHELEEGRVAFQCHGVRPEELDKKLCHVLIEQQENQIVELESELNLAQSKLHEKEAELRALKDCVRRLTQFSISSVSDDESHEQEQQDFGSGWNNTCEIGSESRSVVGMKRPINSAQ